MALTVDQMLEKVGSFEKYQWILLGIVGYTTVTVVAFSVMIVTFLTAEPEWICVKGYNNTVCNFTDPISLTSENYKARCSMSREAWTFVEGFTSLVTEYDLVCSKSYLLSVAQSCFWAGMLVGLIFGGYLTDRFGRRRMFYLGIVGVILVTWIMVFPKEFAVFIVTRVFIGLATGLLNCSRFILLTEYTCKMHRAKIGIMSFYFWTTGILILALIGFFLPNWRHFLFATVVLATPAIFFWWLIPESIRWLLLNSKDDEARKQLSKVAKINKKPLPEDKLEKPVCQEMGNFCHLFSNWETTKRTLLSWNIWFTVSLVYFGVTYGSVDLGWNRYLTFALTSLIEYPANYTAIWTTERFGRKKTTAFGLVLACLASIIAVSIPYERTRKPTASTIFRIIMAVLAKFFITLSFSTIYVWTVELFPTFIRGMALCTSSAAGRVGSISASYVIWLIRIHPMLPFGIMGLACLQSAILTMFLPETNGQPTLETMVDMEQKQDGLLSNNLNEEPPVVNNNKRDLAQMYLNNQHI